MSLDKLLTKLDNYETFSEKYRQNGNGFELGNHQLVPIFNAVDNGLRRFLLIYGTGGGKTAIPIEIIKHLQRQKESHKTLVLAPYQTLKTWEEALQEHKLSMNMHTMRGTKDIMISDKKNFVIVNYDKLPLNRSYHKEILEYADNIDLLIPDECHNNKNRNGKISQVYQKIIERSKHARMIALSATPCPDKISDFGMNLFAIDPDRYGHYKDIPFSPKDDPEAIWEMRESGKILFFDKKQVSEFFDLPKFTEHEPLNIKMDPKYVERYFKAFKDHFELGKALYALERISIEAIINNDQTMDVLNQRLKEGYVLNFFSHLRNPPKNGSPDQGIFFQLEKMLKKIGAKNIAYIHGNINNAERLQIQKEMRKGSIDVLINQWGCTHEGFSEVAGHRPVSIVPTRSPFSSGVKEQIQGRPHRPGQFAPVEYRQFHADSQQLREWIDDYARDYARKHRIKVKSSWSPTLFHQDADNICKGKKRVIMHYLYQRSQIAFDEKMVNVNSVSSYTRALSKERIFDYSNTNGNSFGNGTRRAIQYVGVPYEEGLLMDPEALGKDYNKKEILLHSPGKINIFLTKVIEDLKEKEQATNKSWKIADLGCCSSAVFSQARLLWKALQDVKGNNVCLDEIVNVDGEAGFINSAKNYLKEGIWIETIPKLERESFTKKDFQKAYHLLKNTNYMKNLHFLQSNFVKENFGTNYDVVICSQSLQYNDQTNNRDIEKVVMNVNHALKPKGHYLTILTGNTFKHSFTKWEDIKNYLAILDAYGFKVEKSAHIEGKSKNKVVLKPFHFIYASKVKNHKNGFAYFDSVLDMYPADYEVLTGGSKKERLTRCTPTKEIDPTLPDRFIDAKGNPFKIY